MILSRFRHRVIVSIICLYTAYNLHCYPNEIIIIQAPEKRATLHPYMMAAFYDAQGKTQKALESYEELFKKNPSAHSYGSYFSFLLNRLGECEKIVTLYEQRGDIQDAIKGSFEPQLIVAQAYLNLDQDSKAEKIFESLAEKYPDNEQVTYFACLSLLKRGELDKAMVAIDQALNNFVLKQRHFLFYLLKSKLLVQQNKLKDALETIEKSIDQFPKFDRALLFKAVLLEQMGAINESIKGYQKFLDVAGHDLTVEKQLIQLLFAEQRYGEALTYLKRAKEAVPTPDYFFDLGLIEFKSNRFPQALSHLDQALKLDPTYKKACILKIETFLQMRKQHEALGFTSEWVAKNPSDPAALHTLMLLRKAGVQIHTLIKTLTAIESKVKHINIFATLADLNIEAKNTKQAQHYYTKMLNITNDGATKSKILFHLGYLYFITNQHAQLEKTLQQALAATPAYPSAYNLLAYHYAQNNKKLPEALEFINKALAAAPRCSYFLDTKGYVLFKQGQKEQALTLFKQAQEIDPMDPVIKNHIKLVVGEK